MIKHFQECFKQCKLCLLKCVSLEEKFEEGKNNLLIFIMKMFLKSVSLLFYRPM